MGSCEYSEINLKKYGKKRSAKTKTIQQTIEEANANMKMIKSKPSKSKIKITKIKIQQGTIVVDRDQSSR